MGATEVRDLFAALGGDVDVVAWGTSPGEVPSAGSHRWIVLDVEGGDVVIGGLDRSRFAAYGRFAHEQRAAETLTVLLRRPPPAPLPRTEDQLARAARGLVVVLDEAGGVGGGGSADGVAGAAIPVGAVLDHLGHGSGHVLYPLGTPMSQRSLPPTDLTQPRTGYLVVRPLPDGCRATRAPAWFGQPGGGWMITLDRVIDYYCDVGVLQPFAIDEEPH